MNRPSRPDKKVGLPTHDTVFIKADSDLPSAADEIAGYIPLRGGEAVDFRHIGNDDEAFENFVEALLTELGFSARRTGRGPDLGVDIIAEKVSDDAIGGPRTLRYAVECKHYAHSGRTVGVSDVKSPAIRDRVAATSANGFLLVTSTSVTASLKRQFEQLSSPTMVVECWDAGVLARLLAESLPLRAKYFPTSLHGTAVPLKQPRGRSQAYCFSQVRQHQHEYVGAKYIPSLYVGREIERQVLLDLQSPVENILRCEAMAKRILAAAEATARSPFSVPLAVAPQRYRHDVFTIQCDAAQARTALDSFADTLRSIPVAFVSAYGLRGSTGLRDACNDLARTLTSAQDELTRQLGVVFGVADAFGDELKRLEGTVLQIGGLKESLRRSTKLTRETRREVLAKIKRLEFSFKHPAWRDETRWCRHISKAGEGTPRSLVTDVEAFIQSCDDIRSRCLSDLLADLTHSVESLSRSLVVLVDIAGTGKTNLCCRVAFELTPHAFVLFLTAKSQGDAFRSLKKHLHQYITAAFPARVRYGLAENCRWLHARQSPLVVIIDGINEASDHGRLKRDLAAISALAVSAPIRILLTSRAEYWAEYQSALPLLRDAEVIEGALGRFTEDEQRLAVHVYLEYYRLKVRLEGSAWEQLKRPLLLRFFCEAYGNPLKRKYRQLPVVSRVSLVKLFDAYVLVKYQNITDTVSRKGIHLGRHDVATILLAIADRLLRLRVSSIARSSIGQGLPAISGHWREIVAALLDEDIILEQRRDEEGGANARVRIGFVYEAFMEYLMAAVLVAHSRNSDRRLVDLVRRHSESKQRVTNIKGIATFLLPACVGDAPKAYSMVLSDIIEPSLSELCVPALLNLWDSDWERGIWPLLQAIVRGGINPNLEEVSAYIAEWVEAHDPMPLFRAVENDPDTLARCAGIGALRLLNDSRVVFAERKPAIKSVLASLRSSEAVIEEVLTGLLTEVRRGTWVPDSDDVIEVVELLIPRLSSIATRGRRSRDWRPLWLLGEIAERVYGAAEAIRSHRLLLRVESIVEAAVKDGWYFARPQAPGAEWWCRAARVNVKELLGDKLTYLRSVEPFDEPDFDVDDL